MRKTLTALTLCVLTLATTAFAAEKAPSRTLGWEWVRSRPLTIMGLIQRVHTFDAKEYRGAGLNTLLIWKRHERVLEKAKGNNLPWLGHAVRKPPRDKPIDPFTPQVREMAQKLVKKYPGCIGWVLWDEPYRQQFPKIAEVAAWFRKTFPGTMVFSNLYPNGGKPGKYYGGKWLGPDKYEIPPRPWTYDDYAEEYIEQVQPDVLMFDVYPFKQLPEAVAEEYIHRVYFANMESIRRAALRAKLPYWVFIQSMEIKGWAYLPSESDLRMQLFSSLAYGFTGIGYFLYDGGLVTEHGKQSRLYNVAAHVNKEVLILGQALRMLTSVEVLYVLGSHVEDSRQTPNRPPQGVKLYTPRAGTEFLRNVTIAEKGLGRDVLIGLFRDEKGGWYIMPVNLHRQRGKKAAEMKATVTLKFSDSVKSLGHLSRATGKAELIALKNHTLTVTLAGGTAELYKIGDKDFPGLEK